MLKKFMLFLKNWDIQLKLRLLAIFLPIFLTVILYKLRTIEFATNDDPFYSFIASGSIYGFPSSELIFISKPIGFLMKTLYTINLDWPWYAIVALATQGVAITLALFMISRISFSTFTKSDIYIYIMVFVIAFFISSIFFLKLQFTHISILSAGIGSLLLMRGKSKAEVLFSIALMVAGLLWRLEGGLLGILLTIPFFFLFRDTARNLISKLILVATVLCGIGLTTYLTWGINSPFLPSETKEFIKFNNARGQLDGLGSYSNKRISGQTLAQVGLTENDWKLFGNWYFADPAIFTTQRLETLSENRSISNEIMSLKISELLAISKEIFGDRLALGISLILFLYLISNRCRKHPFKNEYIFSFLFFSQSASYSIYLLGLITAEYALVANFFLLLITFFFFIAYPPYNNKNIIYVFLPAVLSVGILLVIGILGRAPLRIIEPSLYIIFLCTALMSIDLMQLNKKVENFEVSKPNKGFGKYKINVSNRTLILSILFLAISFQVLSYDLHIAKTIIDKDIDKYKNLNTDKPIIAFPQFYTPLLSIFPLSRTSNHPTILKKMIVLGSTTRSPDYLRQVKLMSLSADLFTSVACGDAYIGIAVDGRGKLNLISEYLKDHHNIQISWPSKPIASINGLEIWTPTANKLSCQ